MKSKTLLLLTALACHNLYAQQGSSPAEAKIRQLEEDAGKASEKGDSKWFADHLSSVWILLSHKEKITLNKTEAVALVEKQSVASSSAKPAGVKVTKEDMKVVVQGKTAVASYKQTLTFDETSQQKPKVEFVLDVFTEVSQGWVIVYSQEDSADTGVV